MILKMNKRTKKRLLMILSKVFVSHSHLCLDLSPVIIGGIRSGLVPNKVCQKALKILRFRHS